MNCRSRVLPLLAVGLACAAAVASPEAQAAHRFATGQPEQAVNRLVSALGEWIAPYAAGPAWSAKAYGGRHAKPRGGKPTH